MKSSPSVLLVMRIVAAIAVVLFFVALLYAPLRSYSPLFIGIALISGVAGQLLMRKK